MVWFFVFRTRNYYFFPNLQKLSQSAQIYYICKIIAMLVEQKPPIYLFTDGAASGNPGPGGYGVVLRCGSYQKELSGGFARTTNNRMELLAVIIGLEQIRWDNAQVHVVSDSSYVVKALNEGWLENWKRSGFKGKKNVDLWLRFDAVYQKHRVAFHWIKGHAGHPENERCDRLAVEAYSHPGLPPDEGYEASTETLL